MNKNEVITVEAEEIPIEKAVEKSFISAIEKHEITKKLLEEKKNECLALKLNGQDKEAYTLIRETRLNMKANRVAVEKVCKKGREDATKTQKAWLALEKEYVGIISIGEDYLSGLEEEFENEAERIKQEAKRKQEEAFIVRQADLNRMGVQYVDGNFVLNGVSYEAVLVKESDDEVWGTIRDKFNEQHLINEESRLAEEKRKAEEAEALRLQREEQERKQRELEEREAAIKAKEQEEIDRKEAIEKQMQAEAKAKLDERTRSRSNQLAALGMKYHPDKSYSFDEIVVSGHYIETAEGGWDETIEEITPKIEEKKKIAEENRLAEIEEQKRIAAEEAVKKEQERVAEEARKAEEKRQREEAARAEELLKATDKEKWKMFIDAVSKIQIPDMKHIAYKGKAQDAKKFISKIKEL